MDPLLLSRIAAKTSIPVNIDTECWIWTGAKSKKRRGQRRPNIKWKGKNYSVGRLVCTEANGEPPSPQHEAGHICPSGERCDCVSPFHFKWMTRVENEQWKRGYSGDL